MDIYRRSPSFLSFLFFSSILYITSYRSLIVFFAQLLKQQQEQILTRPTMVSSSICRNELLSFCQELMTEKKVRKTLAYIYQMKRNSQEAKRHLLTTSRSSRNEKERKEAQEGWICNITISLSLLFFFSRKSNSDERRSEENNKIIAKEINAFDTN